MPKRPKPLLPPIPHLVCEQAFWQQGQPAVAGIDEAGRGAWAGPVVAAAVVFSPAIDLSERLLGVTDSKKLSAAQRRILLQHIQAVAQAWGVGQASASEIDAFGILPATRLAMQRAVQALVITPDALLIDAVRLPELPQPQQSFFFADSISLSVAAASIIAKVTRDQLLCELANQYPHYGFAQHKGYGTAQHRAALAQHGASPEHRLSYRPLQTPMAAQLTLGIIT